MHLMMWIFWGSLAAIFLIAWIVDVVTRGKCTPYKSENSLNQNSAEADARRHAGRGDHQGPL